MRAFNGEVAIAVAPFYSVHMLQRTLPAGFPGHTFLTVEIWHVFSHDAGVDAIERLRSGFRGAFEIPALLISGDASSPQCEVGSRAYQLLYKPVNVERFHSALVASVLGSRRPSPAPAMSPGLEKQGPRNSRDPQSAKGGFKGIVLAGIQPCSARQG
jgi:hypothetical protein